MGSCCCTCAGRVTFKTLSGSVAPTVSPAEDETQQVMQICPECSLVWNNIEFRAGPCDRCQERQVARRGLIMELFNSEKLHNKKLHRINDELFKKLMTTTIITPSEHTRIFGELPELLAASSLLLSRLHASIKAAKASKDENLNGVKIGYILDSVYSEYAAFLPFIIKSDTNLLELSKLKKESDEFKKMLESSDLDDPKVLEELFTSPHTHISSYPGCIDKIIKRTPLTHPDREALEEVAIKMDFLITNIKQYTTKNTKDTLLVPPEKPKRRSKNLELSSENISTGAEVPVNSGAGREKISGTTREKISLNPFDSDDDYEDANNAELNVDEAELGEKSSNELKISLNPFGSETSSEGSDTEDKLKILEEATEITADVDELHNSLRSREKTTDLMKNDDVELLSDTLESLILGVNTDEIPSCDKVLGSVESFHSSCVDVEASSQHNNDECSTAKDRDSDNSYDFNLSPSQLQVGISDTESDTDFKMDEQCFDKYSVNSETEHISIITSSSS